MSKSNTDKVIKPVQKPRLIYCGPDLPFVGIKQFQVFSNGIPKMLSDCFTACPEIKSLTVEVKNLASVRSKLNVPGEIENINYKKIISYKNEVKK